MNIQKTKIKDLLIIQPQIFTDERGEFFESYNKLKFKKIGLNLNFIQDNQSLSKKGVLRGLHFQNPPFEQGKLVRVTSGSVLDVAVDIRINSKTYGQHVSIVLSAQNKTIFWIPPGFAHGFISLEDNTTFNYKCTEVYNKNSEGSLFWNDPDLNINWGIKKPFVSKKDQDSEYFKNFQSKFK